MLVVAVRGSLNSKQQGELDARYRRDWISLSYTKSIMKHLLNTLDGNETLFTYTLTFCTGLSNIEQQAPHNCKWAELCN
jgi:hypothetical protein